MKIQCDVCNKEEASVFCSADEAALCSGCDHRVHHANKLASKHHRFSLLNPTNKDAPRCDVCQERRAFLFCREDRAILCRECDGPIHTANEHTQKHNRFLLTGVKLASSASSYPNGNGCDTTTASVDSQQQLMMVKKKDMFVSVTSTPPPSIGSTTPTPSTPTTTSAGGSTSSIAEYLIETLPGWHVEDFLDSSSPLTHGFCKNDNLLPFLDGEFETNLGGGGDDLGIWVPQAPPPSHQLLHQQEKKGASKEMKNLMNKPNSNKRWRMSDHSFTVPQISHPSDKRSTRSFW